MTKFSFMQKNGLFGGPVVMDVTRMIKKGEFFEFGSLFESEKGDLSLRTLRDRFFRITNNGYSVTLSEACLEQCKLIRETETSFVLLC